MAVHHLKLTLMCPTLYNSIWRQIISLDKGYREHAAIICPNAPMDGYFGVGKHRIARDTTTWKIQGELRRTFRAKALHREVSFCLYLSGSCLAINQTFSYYWVQTVHDFRIGYRMSHSRKYMHAGSSLIKLGFHMVLKIESQSFSTAEKQQF